MRNRYFGSMPGAERFVDHPATLVLLRGEQRVQRARQRLRRTFLRVQESRYLILQPAKLKRGQLTQAQFTHSNHQTRRTNHKLRA